MDNCIARRGISHVISEARASLKHPSRPFTPRVSGRSLFYGNEYRPISRQDMDSSCKSRPQHREVGYSPRPSSSGSTVSCSSSNNSNQIYNTVIHEEAKAVPVDNTYDADDMSSNTNSDIESPVSSHKIRKLNIAPSSKNFEDGKADEKVSDQLSCKALTLRDDDYSDMDEDELQAISGATLTQLQDDISKKYDFIKVWTKELSDILASTDMDKSPNCKDEYIKMTEQICNNLQNLQRQYETVLDTCKRLIRDGGSVDTSVLKKIMGISSQIFNTTNLTIFNDFHKDIIQHESNAYDKTKVSVSLALLTEMLVMVPNIVNIMEEYEISSYASIHEPLLQMIYQVYSISKISEYDALFCNVRFVEAILGVLSLPNEPKSTTNDEMQPGILKIKLYLAGILKNVSANDNMIKILASNGAISVLSHMLVMEPNCTGDGNALPKFIVQNTAILRDLSVKKLVLKQFVAANTSVCLLKLLSSLTCNTHEELVWNILRILSKLTLHEKPRSQLNQDYKSTLRVLIQLLQTLIHQRSSTGTSSIDKKQKKGGKAVGPGSIDGKVVRVLFILGNLCAGNDRNRRWFLGGSAASDHVILGPMKQSASLTAVQFICGTFTLYSKEYLAAEKTETVEALIKIVRLIANLAINNSISCEIYSNPGCKSVPFDLIKVTHSAASQQISTLEHDELLLNTVSCLTNISYAFIPYPGDPGGETSHCSAEMDKLYRKMTQLLRNVLLNHNEETVLEAIRALGNITRHKYVLELLQQESHLLIYLIRLLDSCNRDIVLTVCGVLMNVALHKQTRKLLLAITIGSSGETFHEIQEGIGTMLKLLLSILCQAENESQNIDPCDVDVELCGMACKVIYNLTLGGEKMNCNATAAVSITVSNLLHVLDANDKDSDHNTAKELVEILYQLQQQLAM